MRKQLRKLFQPESVAVIGASDDHTSIGYMVMKNLLEGTFKGRITPINLRHRTVQGLESFYYIADLKEAPELAVIATPDYAVLQVIRECGEAGVGAIAVLAMGFQESGKEARYRLERVKMIAREYGMRVLGPNCLGFINPHIGLNASFATRMAKPGNIAFISQSGALGISTLDWAVEQNVGFSYFVSVGAMADISYADLIDFFGTDHRTNCILIYMESLTEARRFMSAARAFARYKPIIVLKAGRSQEGKQAALSHTGALVGNDAVFSAAFRRSGIIRVNTIAQLFNCAQSLAMQTPPVGNRLAILSNAGGPGVLATDYLIANGGQLATLSNETYNKLNEHLPINWSHSNPVNILGDASAALYKEALTHLLRDAHTDAVLVILTYQSMTEPEAIAKAVVEVNKKSRKPLFATWMGERGVREARDILETGQVPPYRYPESAVDVFLKMYAYHRNLQMLYETPPEEPQQFQADKARAQNIISAVRKEGRLLMMEHESKALLACYELPVADHQLATTADEAVDYAKQCGYPVAMKVASPSLYHKTDVGGIRLDLRSGKAVRKAFEDITAQVKTTLPEITIHGVIVERMVHKPFELLIGGRKDEVLGPVVAFGKGGIEVEVYNDAQLGLPPLNMALAHRIIERTQIYPLLKGYRGLQGVDLELLAFTLCKFAYLLMDFPEIREADINPFVMDEKSGVMLDAHIVLEPEAPAKSSKPFQHLVLPPYPGRYQKNIRAKNGKTIRLRPIRPEDEPMELEMVNRLSKESLYFRFFGYVPRMTHEIMTRFTQIDYDREMAIIALAGKPDQEEMIGVVRIIADPWGETAEYAILVADEWQGQGLGSKMTDYIIEIAKDMELQRLYASVLASNKGMITLFERKGFTIEREDFDTYKVELAL